MQGQSQHCLRLTGLHQCWRQGLCRNIRPRSIPCRVAWLACGAFGACGLLGYAFSTFAVAPPQTQKAIHFIRHGTAVHNVRYSRRLEVFGDLVVARSKTEADRHDRRLFPEIEEWAYMTNETLDTSLVDAGVREAQSLGRAWARGETFEHDRGGKTQRLVPTSMCDIDLIVTSPLTRTLQTTMNVFFATEMSSTGDAKQLTYRCQPRVGDVVDASCKARETEGGEPCGLSAHRRPAIVALDVLKEWSQGRHTPNRRKNKHELASNFPLVDFTHVETEEDSMWKPYWPGEEDGLEPRFYLETRVAQFKQWLTARPEQNIAVVSHGTFLGNLLFNNFIEDTNELKHCQIYMDYMGRG